MGPLTRKKNMKIIEKKNHWVEGGVGLYEKKRRWEKSIEKFRRGRVGAEGLLERWKLKIQNGRIFPLERIKTKSCPDVHYDMHRCTHTVICALSLQNAYTQALCVPYQTCSTQKADAHTYHQYCIYIYISMYNHVYVFLSHSL